ncbi:hypothetical protein [Neisseria arctica]|uniref:hypothetical protein n=1 Tax=Neisseria arctica TaxID=1470200 RepID=UPI000ADD6857|nr:hypothetical protein [Neisseria arctica]UOO86694.1 hypothetical protein LVJ86_00025 [Neisseria arctica]
MAGKCQNYQTFAREIQPFVKNANSGYYKINLYPIAFQSTDVSLWQDEFSEIPGFQNKNEYINFCRKYRFIEMNRWVETYRPRLIICFGKSYSYDFNLAFSDGFRSFKEEIIENHVLQWKRNENGTIVAVLPFPSGASDLNSHLALQLFGERLTELLI